MPQNALKLPSRSEKIQIRGSTTRLGEKGNQSRVFQFLIDGLSRSAYIYRFAPCLTRHEPANQSKNQHLASGQLQKHLTSISCKLELAIWSRNTGQRIPCFDRCQLIITWMSNIKEVHSKPRLHLCQPIIWSMAAILRDSTVAVVRTRPRAIPLAMTTMRKSIHWFHLISIYGMLMGLRYNLK